MLHNYVERPNYVGLIEHVNFFLGSPVRNYYQYNTIQYNPIRSNLIRLGSINSVTKPKLSILRFYFYLYFYWGPEMAFSVNFRIGSPFLLLVRIQTPRASLSDLYFIRSHCLQISSETFPVGDE